ncbi:hypothetical protein D9M68_877810 [compost metagenome]
MSRPVERCPDAASERINTTIARLDEASTARTAEMMRATGQALSSSARKAESAADVRSGSVAAPIRCSDSNISPIPTRAAPAPLRAFELPRPTTTPESNRSGESQPTPIATIQAVIAVPTLAPSNTTCAMRGRMRSRSTKDATMRAVAVEL